MSRDNIIEFIKPRGKDVVQDPFGYLKDKEERTEEQDKQVYEFIGRIYATTKMAEYSWDKFLKGFQSFCFYSETMTSGEIEENIDILSVLFESFRNDILSISEIFDKN